jgi:hypothetical protein
MSKLPYRASTSTGNQFDFEFPLHPETVSVVQVHNLLTGVLGALDREISNLGKVANGDVLQALAMALAVRTRMLPGDPQALAGLARDLTDASLSAPVEPGPGNVPPDAPRSEH